MPSRPTPERPWIPVINGPALRLARARKGWSLTRLVAECAQLGTVVDRGNLSRAEHGKPGSLGVEKVPAVAEALGVDVADLLTDHGKALAPLQQAS
jgi:transcriptional regulator with XRE-family HTH domain